MALCERISGEGDISVRENLEFPVPEVFRDFPSYSLDRLDETSVQNADAAFLAETPEKAPSMEIQAAMIREIFLNSEPLQFENWTSLSLDARVIALNQLEGDVAQISCRDALPVLAEQMPIRSTVAEQWRTASHIQWILSPGP